MTLRNASDKKKKNPLFSKSFYVAELRRTWYAGLVFMILLFFMFPVFTLLYEPQLNVSDWYTGGELTPIPAEIERQIGRIFLQPWFGSGSYPFAAYALIAGTVFGFSLFGYFFDRKKTNFLCSLPVSRECCFLTKAAASATWAVLPLIPAYLLTLIVFLCSSALRPFIGLMSGYFLAGAASFLCGYVFFAGLSALAASFAGNAWGCVGGYLFLVGVLPAAYFLLIMDLSYFLQSYSIYYYENKDALSVLSGAFRYFATLGENRHAGLLFSFLIPGLLYLVLSFFLMKKRPAERAGDTVVFRGVREAGKFVVTALAGLLGGMLFYILAGRDLIWMLFGIAVSCVLAWMLVNTLIYRTPRRMFAGVRGMLILCACLLVTGVFCERDVFGLDTYLPSERSIRSVEIYLDDTLMEIDDPGLITLWHDAAEKAKTVGKDWKPSQQDPPFHHSSALIRTKTGIPLAKSVTVENESYERFLTAVYRHEDFGKWYCAGWRERLSEGIEDTRFVQITYRENDGTVWRLNGDLPDARTHLETYIDALEEDIRANGAEAFFAETNDASSCITLYLADGGLRLPIPGRGSEALDEIIEALGYDPVGVFPKNAEIANVTLITKNDKFEIDPEQFLSYCREGILFPWGPGIYADHNANDHLPYFTFTVKLEEPLYTTKFDSLYPRHSDAETYRYEAEFQTWFFPDDIPEEIGKLYEEEIPSDKNPETVPQDAPTVRMTIADVISLHKKAEDLTYADFEENTQFSIADEKVLKMASLPS